MSVKCPDWWNTTRRPVIETFSGIMFDILNPTLDMIRIEDIAHAGSQLCRFTGHTKFFYSVALHEYLGSYMVPPKNALEFLVHDAAESYLNDLSRPVKHMTEVGEHYRPIEENIQRLVRIKFGLPEVQSAVIHEVDNLMLWTEKKQLMGQAVWESESRKVCLVGEQQTADIRIPELTPKFVERLYLKRFNELKEKSIADY